MTNVIQQSLDPTFKKTVSHLKDGRVGDLRTEGYIAVRGKTQEEKR